MPYATPRIAGDQPVRPITNRALAIECDREGEQRRKRMKRWDGAQDGGGGGGGTRCCVRHIPPQLETSEVVHPRGWWDGGGLAVGPTAPDLSLMDDEAEAHHPFQLYNLTRGAHFSSNKSTVNLTGLPTIHGQHNLVVSLHSQINVSTGKTHGGVYRNM